MSDPDGTPSTTAELLTFQLGDEEFAVDIMCVREIRSWTKATPMPHAPRFMEGVVNLRGTILPVMELAGQMGMGPTTPSNRSVVIVIKSGEMLVGFITDSVSDIITVDKNDLQPPPELAAQETAPSITALILLGDRTIRVLNVENVLFQFRRHAA